MKLMLILRICFREERKKKDFPIKQNKKNKNNSKKLAKSKNLCPRGLSCRKVCCRNEKNLKFVSLGMSYISHVKLGCTSGNHQKTKNKKQKTDK